MRSVDSLRLSDPMAPADSPVFGRNGAPSTVCAALPSDPRWFPLFHGRESRSSGSRPFVFTSPDAIFNARSPAIAQGACRLAGVFGGRGGVWRPDVLAVTSAVSGLQLGPALEAHEEGTLRTPSTSGAAILDRCLDSTLSQLRSLKQPLVRPFSRHARSILSLASRRWSVVCRSR